MCYTILIFSCILVFKLYSIGDDLLSYTPKYKRVKSKHRYILKNSIKSCILFILFVYASYAVKNWENERIRNVAAMYVSSDIVGLFFVPGLHTSTRIHHVVSILFILYAFQADFETSSTAQMLYYYTYFSAATFYVNMYLGLRFCYDLPKYIPMICCCGYGFTLCVSWIKQLTLIEWSSLPYLGLLSLIVFDDVVLLKWLYAQSK
jgi:hypothetical protein